MYRMIKMTQEVLPNGTGPRISFSTETLVEDGIYELRAAWCAWKLFSSCDECLGVLFR